jgi:hypothetical protein
MLLKGLDSMEEAHPLLVLHWNLDVTIAIYEPDCIPIHLSTICHKFLEFGFRNTVLCHNNIEVLPKYTLSSYILLLYITNSNSHNLAVYGVIDMASYCRSMLDMIKIIHAS